MRAEEIREHLTKDIIPFWKHLRDDENGGYYGWMDLNAIRLHILADGFFS